MLYFETLFKKYIFVHFYVTNDLMTWVKNFDLYARYVSKILLYDEKEKMDWRLFLIFMQYKIAFSAGKKKCSNFEIIR